jgi:hypothetical protein
MKNENEIKNLSASIKARLTNKSKETSRPFSEILQYYAMERFLYRLGQTEYRDWFILKGALMFAVWRVSESRATMDIDLLGQFDNRIAKAESIMKEICRAQVAGDGLLFDPDTVKVRKIKEGAEYEGVRVKFTGFLERSRIWMQVDIGFGDTIYPKPQIIDYPVILDLPKPRIKGYPMETVVAEKFEAMVKLGVLNSRMKDFYDVWLMIRQFDFEGESLVKALDKTFTHRKTMLPDKPPFFVDSIYETNSDQQELWRGFLNILKAKHAPATLSEVAKLIEAFLEKPVKALAQKKGFDGKWKALGPWR